ncbi:MAG: hypothetical protein ACR2P2_18375 [Nakamurella sp.]
MAVVDLGAPWLAGAQHRQPSVSVGLRAWSIGQTYAGHVDVARVAGPVMDELRDELRETIQLARLQSDWPTGALAALNRAAVTIRQRIELATGRPHRPPNADTAQ